jgi:hypothetical protein
LIVVGVFAWSAPGQTKDASAGKGKQEKPSPTSNQLLMRDKLSYASKALEGLAVEDFTKIAESANMMRIISRAASWHVDGSEEYARYARNFQEEAVDLVKHANEKNLDAAALDYTRITTTCVQCHKYLRKVQAKGKP